MLLWLERAGRRRAAAGRDRGPLGNIAGALHAVDAPPRGAQRHARQSQVPRGSTPYRHWGPPVGGGP